MRIGATYLSGGLGGWGFVFCTLMRFVTYKGLEHYYVIGIGSVCVCDSILALWFFAKAPSIFALFRRKPATNFTLPS